MEGVDPRPWIFRERFPGLGVNVEPDSGKKPGKRAIETPGPVSSSCREQTPCSLGWKRSKLENHCLVLK